MSLGQVRVLTQLVGWQQRTTTSKQQHSVVTAPVAGSWKVMQQATVVLPLGNTVPETWVQLVLRIGKLHGFVIFGGGKKTTAPLEPWQEIEMSVGQANSGWQLPVCGGQLVTSTLKQQHRRK